MGGGSNSKSKSNSSSIGQTIYSTTSTNNPFVNSTTNMYGTNTSFAPNSALSYVNDYVSKNMGDLIDEYVNPSLDSATNQYLLNNYNRNLSKEAKQMLNNQIISPLVNRNMLRSSQATNMYNNLANTLTDKMADYQASLYENTQNQTANKLKTLYDMYMNGYNVVSGNQAQSLNTSSGGATRVNQGSSSGSSSSTSYGL